MEPNGFTDGAVSATVANRMLILSLFHTTCLQRLFSVPVSWHV